jgi:hypothetical protein
VLDATAGGTLAPDAGTLGGFAAFNGSITNYGHITAESSDYPTWNEQISGDLTNESGGQVTVSTGELQLYGPASSNDAGATVTVAPNAELQTVPQNTFGSDTFTDLGTVTNSGTVDVSAYGGSDTWQQEGGSLTGNAVIIDNGSQLADSAGTGAFVINYSGAYLSGTIPSTQTVTVAGVSYTTDEGLQTTTSLNLVGSTPVINDGTLVLDATGTSTTGTWVDLNGPSSLVNNGMLEWEFAPGTSWTDHIAAAISNGSTGKVTISGPGTLAQDNNTPTTNSGDWAIAPGSDYLLTQGSTFTNESAGVFSPEIASATSFGLLSLQSACCSGSSKFIAGGALDPVLLNGYNPSAGTAFALIPLQGGQFSGTFASVGSGFSADYAGESAANNPFVGALYGGSSSGAAGSGSSGSSGGGSGGSVNQQTSKPLTRAAKLAAAIAKCEKLKKPKQRARCIRAARKHYAPPKHKKKHKKHRRTRG